MYIWRGKNRRDKRNLLLAGETQWGPPRDARSNAYDDEILRFEGENAHVSYFSRKIELLMQQYLDTKDGRIEVNLVMKEIKKNRDRGSNFRDYEELTINQKEIMEKNIFEIYRMFSIDYSSRINRDGLRRLMSYLGMSMGEKQFDKYCRNLNLNEVRLELEFANFYAELVQSIEKEKNKASSWFLSRFKALTSSGQTTQQKAAKLIEKRTSTMTSSAKLKKELESSAEQEEEKENKYSLSYHLQKKITQIEAKLTLVDCAVYRAEEFARQEYRVAHPPKLRCEQCDEAFPTPDKLQKHTKDHNYHREKLSKQINNEERFLNVQTIFTGEQGRRLRANRLIFNRELDSLESRVEVAIADPFRPQLSDPTGKRYAQQLKGAFVQGFDAKSGIRPAFRQSGLMRQHLAPLRNKSALNSLIQQAHVSLQDVLTDLLRCKDNFVDTVSTFDTHHEQQIQTAEYRNMELEEFLGSDQTKPPMYATVRIIYNGFADGTISIIGEFNGWRDEPMINDAETAKWFVVKQLCPGRYRYRFVVNSVQCIDSVASWVPDSDSPNNIGSNVVVVTNSAILHHKQAEKNKNMSPIRNNTGGFNNSSSSPLLLGNVSDKNPRNLFTSHSQKNMMTSFSSPKFGRDSPKFGEDDDTTASPSTLFSRQSRAESRGDMSRGSEHSTHYEGKIIHISRTDKKDIIKRLQHINLRNTALYDDGVWVFSTFVQENSFIMSLDLSYNDISDEGIEALGNCLAHLLALSDLKLNGNGFGVDGMRCIVNNVNDRHTLTNLELSNNRLGDDGMEVLCEHLQYNECIKHLYVDANLIGNEGMECLHHALLLNNTLLSISLASNNISVFGVNRLCKALEDNACLSSLNLNANPLGPEGAKFLGDMLFVNNSLKKLELACTNMMQTGSSFGIHGICCGLKRNRGLTSLSVKNNGLSSEHIVVEIADILCQNSTLQHIDLTGNQIANKKWFQVDTYIPTKLNPNMPSVETSLDRNRKHFAVNKAEIETSLNRVKFAMDDVKKGRWTSRRVWKRVVFTDLDKIAERKAVAVEHDRITAENEYIKIKLEEHMNLMRLYLKETPCRQYLTALAKAITQYIYDLPKVPVQDLPQVGTMNGRDAAGGATMASIRSESVKIRASSAASSTKPGSSSSKEHNKAIGNGNNTTSGMLGALTVPLKAMSSSLASLTTSLPAINNTSISDNSAAGAAPVCLIDIPTFLNAHISVLNAVFGQLSRDTPMLINPEKLEQCMQHLALPLLRQEVQHAVDSTIIKGNIYKIGLHKLSDYVLTHAKAISVNNKLVRFRLLADMLLNPPLSEARGIILDNLQHTAYNEIRDVYRAVPENAPLHVCGYCKKRYATQRALDKHERRGYHSAGHRRFRAKEVIRRSQLLFLQQVKWGIAGVFFPAYYELAPAHTLPEHYLPQVMDKIGAEGRPIGVVEVNRTIRVLDVFGEYLHVLLHNTLGWIRYKVKNQEMLFPACRNHAGFDWDTLHIQETVTYYRVNDTLPKSVELKVRHMPLADAEVCGYLKRNDIIECFAVIGDWLQVRYNKEDAAWIMWRTPKGEIGSNTNQLHYNVAVTVNRPKTHANYKPAANIGTGSEGKKKKGGGSTAGKGSDTAGILDNTSVTGTVCSVADGHDDHFNDHILTYEINGTKVKVNTLKSEGAHITREKIEQFNEIRYGKSYSAVNPNEDCSTELLILLPKALQYHLITSKYESNRNNNDENDSGSDSDEALHNKHNRGNSNSNNTASKSKPKKKKIGHVPKVAPSPSTLSQNEIFRYLTHDADRLAHDSYYGYHSFLDSGGNADFGSQRASNNYASGAGGNLNRFGSSYKDDMYNATDEEDGVLLHSGNAGEASGEGVHGGFGLEEDGEDQQEAGGNMEGLPNLAEYNFKPRSRTRVKIV